MQAVEIFSIFTASLLMLLGVALMRHRERITLTCSMQAVTAEVRMTDYMLDQVLSYPHRDHWDRVFWAIVSELHDLG